MVVMKLTKVLLSLRIFESVQHLACYVTSPYMCNYVDCKAESVL